MCLYPRILKNRKYTVTKKNGGNVPILKDKRVGYVPIGCGKCMECKGQKAKMWQVRLQEDLREHKNAKFVTMTFSDESLQELDNEIEGEISGYDRDNEILSLAVRRFLERWRKEYGKSVRHWLVSELGGKHTERVHLHGLIWSDENRKPGNQDKKVTTLEVIQDRWGYGGVKIGNGKEHYVNEQTINYIVKYINKVDKVHTEYNSKIYTSKGIGSNYLKRDDSKRNRYYPGETVETYKTRQGLELALPIYYRNKIYNEEERENLWIEKIDKEIRYVNGVAVDVSESDEEYYGLLEEARGKNKRLGFGDDSINWELRKYQNDRRMLKREERIAKLKNEMESMPI